MQPYDTPNHLDAYVIADKQTDEYVGTIGFTPYYMGSVELYYTVIVEHWGKGFAVEATAALIEALVETFDIKVFCHPENKAAHAVAKKCGLKPEGITFNKNSGINYELFTRSSV